MSRPLTLLPGLELEVTRLVSRVVFGGSLGDGGGQSHLLSSRRTGLCSHHIHAARTLGADPETAVSSVSSAEEMAKLLHIKPAAEQSAGSERQTDFIKSITSVKEINHTNIC